jgi:cytochrome P450
METFDDNHTRDFMDAYIAEMKQDETGFFTGIGLQNMYSLLRTNNDDHFDFQKANQLTTLCVDLFLGGTETTASTVGFALRYLIKFPEIQERARQEIYSVVGKERLPSTEDMPK